jgi:HSP20 family protein
MVVNGILKVKAEVDENETANDYRKREFATRSFERMFNIPENVNSDEISASYRDGILEVVIPKREKEEINKQVDIKVQ